MIHDILQYLVSELSNHLSLRTGMRDRDWVFLGSLLDTEGNVAYEARDHVVLSLANLEESAARAAGETTGFDDHGHSLTANLLFIANFSSYTLALQTLSHLTDYFRQHRHIEYTEIPALTGIAGACSIEPCALSYEEQDHLWGAIGAGYRPSVIYRLHTQASPDEERRSTATPGEPARPGRAAERAYQRMVIARARIEAAYSLLFEIRLLHDYFVDDRCRDVLVEPMADCQMLFALHAMLYRQFGNRCVVVAKVDPPNPWAPSPSKQFAYPFGDEAAVFRFVLRLTRTSLINITDIEERDLDSVLYFANAGDELVRQSVPLLTSPIYRREPTGPEEEITLSLLDASGALIGELKCEASRHKLDIRAFGVNCAGLYTLRDVDNELTFYYAPGLQRHEVLGVLEISTDTGDLAAPDEIVAPGQYRLELHARAAIWRYEVTRKYNLQIYPGSLSIEGERDFSSRQEPGAVGAVTVFESYEPIPLSEERIVLTLRDQQGAPLMDLPNPGMQDVPERRTWGEGFVVTMKIEI